MSRIFLLILPGICFFNTTICQLTYQQLRVDYDSAVQFKNLKIIPIREKARGTTAPILSLNQALQKGLVTISERGTASTENVHWLRVNNKSNLPVFIASGEVVQGGRQDRMVSRDTVLIPTGNDQYIPVMCVEEGRWSEKEKKFVYQNFADPELRKVLDLGKNQVLIWKKIFGLLDSAKIKSPTLTYAAKRQDKLYLQQQEEYIRFVENWLRHTDSSVVGVVCVSGNRIIGCDIFDGTGLFYSEAPALMPGYIDAAITNGSIPKLTDEQVKSYMDKILTDEISQDAYLRKNGKIFKYNGRVIHITGFAE